MSILVSISQQKMIVYSGAKVIFKTKVSTGAKETPTPTGKFTIEAERGEFLYDDSLNRGACDWVSFKDHGGYRFESLPTDWKGKILKGESKKLGRLVQMAMSDFQKKMQNGFLKTCQRE